MMKSKNRIASGLAAFCMIFTLLSSLILPVAVYAEGEVITISNKEDFIDFAKNCSYDLWSVGKKVVLASDISFGGEEIDPIPSFSGSFDGQGHSISDFKISGAYSPAGLFATLEKDGRIEDLTVKAAVSPEGDKANVGGVVGINRGVIENCVFVGTVIGSQNVGGIVGQNDISGSIVACTAGGEVIGENGCGGIVGLNAGLISASASEVKVNTVSLTPGLTLDELNVSLTLDITKLPSLKSPTVSDVGGIAGYSTGIIIGCTNNGRVGYPHIGYNVGGIAGRSCGHLSGCRNMAEVFGRKDVGGIVGQMEPYVNYRLSEDILGSLKTELDRLNAAVDDMTKAAEGKVPDLSGSLYNILIDLEDATDSLNALINGVADYGDGITGEVNRLGDILSETLSRLEKLTDKLPTLSEHLSSALLDLGDALEDLDAVASLGASAINSLSLCAEDIASAFEVIDVSVTKLSEGAASLQNALTVKDEEKIKSAFDTILDGLGDATEGLDRLTAATEGVTEVLKDTAWADDAIEQFGRLTEIFTDVSEAVGVIYDASLEISENIDIYMEKFEEAGDSLIMTIGYFADAMEGLDEALSLMESGSERISQGLDGLFNSLTMKDSEAAKKASSEITVGFEELCGAAAKAEEALSSLAESFKWEGGENSEILDAISDSLNDISSSGGEALSAIDKILSSLKIIFDNLNIDRDIITDSGELIVGGTGELTDSLDRLREAVSLLSKGIRSLENSATAAGEAVVITDEEKLSTALNDAYSALGDIIDAVKSAADIIGETADTLKAAKLWGDEVIASLGEVSGAISDIADAVVTVQSGVDLLRENISFDLTEADVGLDLITAGFGELSDAAFYAKGAFVHIADAMGDIEGAAEALRPVIKDFGESIDHITDAMILLGDMSEDVKDVLRYISGVDPIQLPLPSESITDTANRLFLSISSIENEMKNINSSLTGLSLELILGIAEINDILDGIMTEAVDIIYGLDDQIINGEVSEDEIDDITYGKAVDCENYGSVSGDKNIGGISGSMGLEYSLDPEDDLSPELSVTQKKQYELKAVIQSCTNIGNVTAKYDCAGGISGKTDLGLIYGCESYCAVESQSGNYVGGIAGISAGNITSSFAKSTLSGGKYIGGIVGSGVSKSYSGAMSLVKGCYSMVKIERATQYFGAISGANIGEFAENMFVSDSLSGIDRVSYHGKADPISYEELTKRRSIPEEFYGFTLEFVADGEVIYSTEFDYGESFDSSVFPEIPEKEGFYGRWDKSELECLTFDTTVSVVYKAYTTAIGSEEKRDNGREIFIVQGEFTDTDGITAEASDSIADLELKSSLFFTDEVIEGWMLIIPEDGKEENSIHFLPPSDGCRIFIKEGDSWREAETREFGNYLIFSVNGETTEIRVVRHTVNILPIAIIGGILLIAVAAITIVLVRKKHKKVKEISSEEKFEEFQP